MSTTDEYGDYGGSSYDPVTGWVGWIVFAAVFMVTIGAINAIQGLAALFRDEAYWVTLGGSVVTFDVTTWGWINLIFGILLVIVGILPDRPVCLRDAVSVLGTDRDRARRGDHLCAHRPRQRAQAGRLTPTRTNRSTRAQ